MTNEAVRRIEDLLWLKYDRDFYMTNRSWEEYLASIGCSRGGREEGFQVSDPEEISFKARCGIQIPEELAIKVLVLGGFP